MTPVNQSVLDLSTRGIYFGTSSWKYEGWKDLIYKKDYASKKAFNETCLEEYATHFPCVGIDHTYYSWPLESTLRKYCEQTPPSFLFTLKVTEQITVFRYPTLKRYGKLAGKANPDFLNAEAFKESFLAPLEPFKDRLGPLILEFSQFHPGMIASGREFVTRLGDFFSSLESVHGFRFAVEIRNSGWLKPPYFKMLEAHQVGHVYNSWTKMPPLAEQLELSAPYPPPFFVARLLLKPGRKYAEAVETFSPYHELQEVQEDVRKGAVSLIRRAQQLKVPAFVLVNNRLEGSAPHTIAGINEMLVKSP